MLLTIQISAYRNLRILLILFACLYGFLDQVCAFLSFIGVCMCVCKGAVCVFCGKSDFDYTFQFSREAEGVYI